MRQRASSDTDLPTCRRHQFFPTCADETATFLEYVELANQAKTEAMLADKPALLLRRNSWEREQEKKDLTALQIALLDQDFEMVELLERAFEHLENGREIKAAQFKEIFPNGIPVLVRDPFDFTKIARAIGKNSERDNHNAAEFSRFNPYLETKMKEFEESFDAHENKEWFFNPAHLQEALNVYNSYYSDWCDAQRHVFWRHVIGHVEHALPYCYLQELMYGYNIVLDNGNHSGLRGAIAAIGHGATITRPDAAVFDKIMNSGLNVALHSQGHGGHCNWYYLRDFINDWKVLIQVRTDALLVVQDRILTQGPPPAARDMTVNESCCVL